MLRVLRRSRQNVRGSRGADRRTWTGKSRAVPLLLHIKIICMQLWANLCTLIKLNGTSLTFILDLFLRKRLSCLVVRAAYQANRNTSKVGKTFANAAHSYRELAHWRRPATIWVLRLAALCTSRGYHACGFAWCFAGESACRAASTAPSPAACSNELLEILNGLDAHTVEVDDAVWLHLNIEYGLLWMSFCILVLIVHTFSEQHEHGERRVLYRPRSGEYPGKSSTVGSTRDRSSAPSVWRLTRGGCHQCLVRVQPHTSRRPAVQPSWSFHQQICHVRRAQESLTSLGCR